MNPITVALVYAVVGAVVLPLAFKVFKTNFAWIDIVLASVGAALASLIPNIGGPASLVVMIAILYWRIGGGKIFPDIIVSVFVARLAMLPVLLLLAKHS
jgi:hypothetical protein